MSDALNFRINFALIATTFMEKKMISHITGSHVANVTDGSTPLVRSTMDNHRTLEQ